MITPERVLDALRHVDDPDLKRDIVSLGMVRNLVVEGHRVRFTVMLTTPACPMKEAIQNACITAVKTLVSREADVHVTMDAEVSRATTQQGAIPGVRNIIAVASGKGGVGKSTVAANLAIALAQSGAQVGLVDADLYGPSAPTLFGLEGTAPSAVEGPDGKTRMLPINKHGVWVQSLGFLVPPGQPVVWRGPMASNALKQLFYDTDWQSIDYLVVDLPPGTGDIHITLTQQLPLAGAVVVTSPSAVALADVRKAIGMLHSPAIRVPVLGLVENMAWFETEELPGRRFYLFGQDGAETLADEYGLPVLAQIPLTEGTRLQGDKGQPIALQPHTPEGQAFAELARRVAQAVSIRNARVAQVAARQDGAAQ